MTHLSRSTRFLLVQTTVSLFILLSVVALANGQTGGRKPAHSEADDEPAFKEYRGAQIGMTADEVRKKLGNPADKGDEQDFYVFNEKETAQVLYDKATKKTIAISVDFMSGASGVITPQQVFGAEIEAKPDGSKYKLVRYPKVGYWISYSRTGGESPIVTVTMQKIP
jgi:hypothetical protein